LPERPQHLQDPEGQVRPRRPPRTGRVTQGDPDPPHPPARGIRRTGDQPPGPGTEIRGTIPDRPGLPKPADRGRVRRVLAQHGQEAARRRPTEGRRAPRDGLARGARLRRRPSRTGRLPGTPPPPERTHAPRSGVLGACAGPRGAGASLYAAWMTGTSWAATSQIGNTAAQACWVSARPGPGQGRGRRFSSVATAAARGSP